jgi:hypothetical protein
VKVEKPIDQVPAEEVVEEIVDQNPTQSEEQNDKPQEQVSELKIWDRFDSEAFAWRGAGFPWGGA